MEASLLQYASSDYTDPRREQGIVKDTLIACPFDLSSRRNASGRRHRTRDQISRLKVGLLLTTLIG